MTIYNNYVLLQLMVDGVPTLDGQLVQLLAGVVRRTKQEPVTAHRQLMGVTNARLMDQATPKRNPATSTHAQVRSSQSVSHRLQIK